MTQRIEALRTLLRLREREVAQCERAMETARECIRQAEAHANRASQALTRALTQQENALRDQRRSPANPHVQLHCHACAAQCEARRAHQDRADLGLAEARADMEEKSRDWNRAQIRRDVLANELSRAFREVQRRIGQRLDEEAAQGIGRTAALT